MICIPISFRPFTRLLRVSALLLACACLFSFTVHAVSDSQPVQAHSSTVSDAPPLECRSAVLMEASTGKVLFEQSATEAMPPASVTKIMTLLLVMEAIDAGKLTMEETVTASAHAASMGGSQIFLKEGESMTVRDLIKSVVIASANDAAVALAEHVAGSEDAFVADMNRRAAELGMTSTHFENTNGLDDTAVNHVTSAMDIAIMSRALIAHPEILTYSSIWMDTIRNGAFGLTNTNRLVRFYPGCTGLKTGSTAKAGFCVSVTAEREGMNLICVIMGAESRDSRNHSATELLDWGFANYGLYTLPAASLPPIRVTDGNRDTVPLSHAGYATVLPRRELSKVEVTVQIPATLQAPILSGEAVGVLQCRLGSTVLGEIPITAEASSDELRFLTLWKRMLRDMLAVTD